MKFNWKSMVASVAPMIGTAIGGPFGGLATQAITAALGIKPESSDREIAKAIQKDPEAVLKLRKANIAFSLKMKELEITEEELHQKDRDSARDREKTLKDWTPKALALGITGGFFSLLFCMIFVDVPVGSQTLLNVMTGSLGTAFISIVSYYFGSSHGSAKKTEMLGNQ